MSAKFLAVQTALDPTAVELVEPQKLFDRVNRMHQDIARRAFELFRNEGGLHGHELDHWFKAEAELLHPAHIAVTESTEAVNAQIEVPGFDAKELAVSVDGQQLTISGKKELTKEHKSEGKSWYQEQCSSELLRIINLPVEVDASKTTATLKNGILSLNMPKGMQTKLARVEVKPA